MMRQERAISLRAKLATVQKLNRSDQKAVATEIWRLLERGVALGISKARVLRESGIDSDTDSTKHLGQYAINPEWPTERQESARLNKKPAKYLAILKAAAKLYGSDENELLLEVFGATSINASGGAREAAPEYEELARTLRDIATAVSAKHELQTYFQKVARDGLHLHVTNHADETEGHKLDPDDIELEFSRGAGGLCWPMIFYEESDEANLHDFGYTLSPYPAVVLRGGRVYRDSVSPPLSGTSAG
jgi:hypothetical protein